MEHFIGAFVRVVVFVAGLVSGCKMLAPKLVDLETTFVDVEMDISFFKIRGAGFPHFRFGVEGFHCLPRAVTDAFGVLFGRNKEDFQFVVVSLVVDFEDHTADLSAVQHNAVSFAIRSVNTTLDGSPRNDLAVIVDMVVPLTEFFQRTILNAH